MTRPQHALTLKWNGQMWRSNVTVLWSVQQRDMTAQLGFWFTYYVCRCLACVCVCVCVVRRMTGGRRSVWLVASWVWFLATTSHSTATKKSHRCTSPPLSLAAVTQFSVAVTNQNEVVWCRLRSGWSQLRLTEMESIEIKWNELYSGCEVLLSACISQKPCTALNLPNFCACCIGPPLASLPYLMYIRFYG